jgi:hypothetical protein
VVVDVRFALVFALEVLVGHMGVAKRGVIVLVAVPGAQVLEAAVAVVVVGDMEVLVSVLELAVFVILEAGPVPV